MCISIAHSQTHKKNVFFADFFQKQERNIQLIIHYRDEQPFYDKINGLILTRILEIDLQNIPWEDLTSILQELFLNLNWELYAQFRNYDSSEYGLSLALLINEGKNICSVSCGRFLSGRLNDNGIEIIGKPWENFHIKTKKELALLGAHPEDLKVKPIFLTLSDNTHYFTFIADLLTKIDVKSVQFKQLLHAFAEEYKVQPFPYLILTYSKQKTSIKQNWLKTKKFRFIAILLLLILAFSLYYLFHGANAVEDKLVMAQGQLRDKINNIDLLKLQENIPIDFGILLVPQNNLNLSLDWETTLPFEPTHKPFFDTKYFFLTSNKSISAYDKKSKDSTWKIELDDKITSLTLLDSNRLLVITKDHKTTCIKRDTGEIAWTLENDVEPLPKQIKVYTPMQISLETDRRLSSSIVLYPQRKSISLINILTGEILSQYDCSREISFISEHDYLEKAIYLIEGSKLLKLRIEVRT